MTVFVLASLHGAPGVTTTSWLLAGCMGGVLVEADLDGGVLAVRYGLGREPGMTTFAAARTTDPGALHRHTQDAGGVPVVVGPDAADNAMALWQRAGDRLAAGLEAVEAPVVADVGRVHTEGGIAALLNVASLVGVLVRPEPEDLVGLSHRVPWLRSLMSGSVGVVLVGRGPYSPAKVEAQLGVDVFGVLPEDRRATAMLKGRGGSPRALRQTSLFRAVRSLADDLLARTAAGGSSRRPRATGPIETVGPRTAPPTRPGSLAERISVARQDTAQSSARRPSH